jgi:circadian clock protein KaiC
MNGPPVARHTATGIAGLDQILRGGLPAGRCTLIVGSPGSGKTTLALQFVVNGALRTGEAGMLLTFEESPDRLRDAARSLGLRPESDDLVHIYDGRPVLDALSNGEFDLGGLVAVVGADARRLGVKRVAFDGLDALFAVSGKAEVTGREFRRLVELTDAEALTALISLKPGLGEHDVPHQYESIEYAANGVIRLSYRIERGLLQRILRVVKIRQAGYAAGEHPFIITGHGLDVSYDAAIKTEPVISFERVSTGVPQLDHMMVGGLLRGSTTLISGLPGTAKSTLGASFLAAGLGAGERGLLIALDEPSAQLIANVRSVGIDLAPYAASGQLATISLNAASAIADEHYLTIERVIDTQQPTLLVIDPASAFKKAGGREVARMVIERLTWLVKSRGMTAIFTAVADSQFGELETTTAQVSAIADTWIHLSFAVKGGERNRTLTIVKSRGTAHSNQLREMLLSNAGITLQDVYQIQGEFLLGTARLEREQEHKREMTAREVHVKNLLRELDERKEIALAKLRDAERELLELNERMAAGVQEAESLAAGVIHDRTEIDAARSSGEA